MAITLADLRTKCYNILREEENNSAYPYALVDDLVNDAVWAICSWLYVNPLTKEEIHKGQLPFLNKEVFYETALVQYVTSDVNAGATEIEINTGTRPDAWVCYIWGNIVEYREKDETHLYQCTWINGKIKAGEQASIVYKVPSDFMSPINVILDDRVQIDNKNYDDVFESLRDNKGLPEYKYRMQQWRGFDKPFYVIKDGKYVVTYNINTSWMMLRLRYECKPNILIQPKQNPFGLYVFNSNEGSLCLEQYPEKIIKKYELDKYSLNYSAYCNSPKHLIQANSIRWQRVSLIFNNSIGWATKQLDGRV